MAEERNLRLARARDLRDTDDVSKEALQRRMEEARDSITNTVSVIKDNVAQQVESVKDALDWREHFKKQPVAWTLGAAGVGFFVGYGIAAALTDDNSESSHVYDSESYARPLIPESTSRAVSVKAATPTADSEPEGPGLLERFRETSAYDRLSKEAGSLGDRLVEELSTTAHTVVLPLLLNKIKSWIGVDLSDKSTTPRSSMGNSEPGSTSPGPTSFARSST